MTTATVVICAYTLERWDALCSSVRSAASQDPAPDVVLLVVDHNPQLLDLARSDLTRELPRLQVVANTRKAGLSGARNSALEQVSTDVVAFLDDDATAAPGWLAGLMSPYADPHVLAVGGVANPLWPQSTPGRPVTLPAQHPSSWGELDWVVGCTYAGQPVATGRVRNLMGCNMSFRRSVLARVGGFSEELGRVGKTPLGCEETELCIRALQADPSGSIIFEPSARVQHRVTKDRMTWSYLLRRCYSEGVSKAAVSHMVGRGAALSTERGYVTRVLTKALGRQLLRAVSGRGERLAALAGAGAIVAGLVATVLGYLRGLGGVRSWSPPTSSIARATPLHIEPSSGATAAREN